MFLFKKLHSFFIYLFCFSINFERANLFNLNIDYLSSKVSFLLLFFVSVLNYRKCFSLSWFSSVYRPVVLFFCYLTFISYLNTNYISNTYFNFAFFLNIIVFVILTNAGKVDNDIIVKGVFSFALGSVSLCIFYVSGIGISSLDGGRQTVFGLNQNILGLMLVISFFTIIYFIRHKNSLSRLVKFMLNCCLPLIMLLILKTGSRTGFISFLLSGIIFLLFSELSKVKKILSIMMSIIASFFLWLFYLKDSLIISRLGKSIGEGDLSSRDLIWMDIFTIIKENYLFGIGESGYMREMSSFYSLEVPSPHNVIVEIICYTGVVGLLLIAPFFYNVFIKGYKNARRSNNYLVLIFLVPLLAIILSGQIFDQKMVWILFALIFVNNKISV